MPPEEKRRPSRGGNNPCGNGGGGAIYGGSVGKGLGGRTINCDEKKRHGKATGRRKPSEGISR